MRDDELCRRDVGGENIDRASADFGRRIGCSGEEKHLVVWPAIRRRYRRSRDAGRQRDATCRIGASSRKCPHGSDDTGYQRLAV